MINGCIACHDQGSGGANEVLDDLIADVTTGDIEREPLLRGPIQGTEAVNHGL